MLDPNDSGTDSRKWRALFWSAGLVALTGLAAALWPAIQAVYPTLAGSIVALYGVYCGVNVGAKWVAGRVNGQFFGDMVRQKADQPAGDRNDEQNG